MPMKPIPSNSPIRAERVAGLILAGGLSRRLGSPKQLLPWGDGTLLEHAIRQAEAVEELDPIVVVLPPGDLVPDPRHRRAHLVRRQESDGCSASLRTGLAALPNDIAALAVLPADQPGLTSDLIQPAIQTWQRHRPTALGTRYHGTPGHPLLFAAALLPTLRRLHGDKALWDLVQTLGPEVEWMDVAHPFPADIDTPEDAQRLQPK
jgi:molybdenum cofactor cytidylyltransferase